MELTKRKKSVFISFLSIYLLLMPFDFYPLIEGVSISRFLIFLPLLGVLFEMQNFNKIKGESLWVLLHFMAVSFTYLFTIDREQTYARITTLFLNFAVIILFSMRSYSRNEIKKLFKTIALSGWLFLILTLLYGNFESGRLYVVFEGIEQDPNYFCGYMIFPICYYLWNFLTENKTTNLITALILSVPIFLTGSRGGLLALLVAVFVLFFMFVKTGGSGRYIRFLFATLVIFIALLVFWRFLPENITNRFTLEYNLEDNGAGRFEIWEDIIKEFKDAQLWNKVFGHGAATVSNFNARNGVAHNIYVETLIETGVIGAIMLFVMYYKYGRLALKLKDGFLVATYVGYMVMTLSMSLYSYKPIWNIILLIIIVSVYEKKEISYEQSEENRGK